MGMESRSAHVKVEGDLGLVVLSVRGWLDREGGSFVLQALEAALVANEDGAMIEVDLRGVEGYSAEGRRALVACGRLGERAGARVRFRLGHDNESAARTAAGGGGR